MVKSLYRAGAAVLALAVLMTGTGCGRKNKALTEKELAAQLPDTITTYLMDGEAHTQEVETLEVIKRNTDQDTDFVECEIVLTDDYLERTVYADLYLTYYETGGWLIDTWSAYGSESAVPLKAPDGETAMQTVCAMYPGAVRTEEDTSMLEQGICTVSFQVDEKHTYADFLGTCTVEETFSGWDASAEEMAAYDWTEQVLTDGVQVDWKIEGVWIMTEEVDDLPDKVYFSLDSYDEEQGIIAGTGYYAFPEFPSSEYAGSYGSYSRFGVRMSHAGNSVDSAETEILLDFYHPVTIIITADEISADVANLDGYAFSIEKDPSPDRYSEWDSFPKDPEYEFPTAGSGA